MCSECGQTPCMTRCPNFEDKKIGDCHNCGEDIYKCDTYYTVDDHIVCDNCIISYCIDNTKEYELREFFDEQSLKDRYEYILFFYTKKGIVETLSRELSREDLEEFANQFDTAFIEWRIENG